MIKRQGLDIFLNCLKKRPVQIYLQKNRQSFSSFWCVEIRKITTF
jgi:hypothetical protein